MGVYFKRGFLFIDI